MTPDEQEAKSIAYCTARIVHLTSGNFALLSPYTGGHDIIHIGSLSELEPYIPTFDELSLWHKSETYASAAAPKVNLTALLGIRKPSPLPKIERRL